MLMLIIFSPLSAQEDSQGAHQEHMKNAFSRPAADIPRIKVDFGLLDARGQTVTPGDLRGSYTLLAFGFTHCQTVCPTMAANMARAIERAASPSIGVFISVDTERDTPDIVDKYAKGFSPRLMGLTGSYEKVSEAAANFQAKFVVTKTQKSYTVEHTASLFLIDPDGDLVDVFALNAATDSIVAAMR